MANSHEHGEILRIPSPCEDGLLCVASTAPYKALLATKIGRRPQERKYGVISGFLVESAVATARPVARGKCGKVTAQHSRILSSLGQCVQEIGPNPAYNSPDEALFELLHSTDLYLENVCQCRTACHSTMSLSKSHRSVDPKPLKSLLPQDCVEMVEN
eukprot:773221-Amphidinium_carterae.1